MKEKRTITKTKQDKQTNQQNKTSEQTKEDSKKKFEKNYHPCHSLSHNLFDGTLIIIIIITLFL